MQTVMDRLWECLTELDKVIRRQRRAVATVAAMTNLTNLETARKHIKAAQHGLVRIEADALIPAASAATQETGPRIPGAETS